VTLWERTKTLGGMLNPAGDGHGRSDLHRMREWQVASVNEAGVKTETGRTATVSDVVTFGADTVILATGATRAAAGLQGAAPIDVVEALDAPRDRWQGKRVAVWDEAGSWATLSAAETLAHHGATVEIIGRPTAPLWAVTIYSRMTALERLSNQGVAFRLGLAVLSFADGMLHCRNGPTGAEESLGPYDAIVHSGIGEAATGFQTMLEAEGLRPRVIGDAVAPRTLFDAMHDAHVAARSSL